MKYLLFLLLTLPLFAQTPTVYGDSAIGASFAAYAVERYVYVREVTIAEGGELDSFYVYIWDRHSDALKCALYSGAVGSLTLVDSTNEVALGVGATDNQWWGFEFVNKPTIAAGTYWMATWGSSGGDGVLRMTKVAGGADNWSFYDNGAGNYGVWPASMNAAAFLGAFSDMDTYIVVNVPVADTTPPSSIRASYGRRYSRYTDY